MTIDLNSSILNATKWSSITEVIVKLITPITNMILARILAPESFAVITTVTMIISFADMFTDAGFQKYIIQKNFDNDEEKNNSLNVAFWTNFVISILLWGIICLFSEELAKLVGNPGLGIVISISCVQLPITSFSSIQSSVFKRNFDFKTLFFVRLVGIFIPFFVTIPLALLGFDYWSLVIGSIFGVAFNAIVMTVKSVWKPSIYYNFNVLKKMFSFSMWSLIEAISIWLTTWIDTFIIGSFLSPFYLGIYKTSLSTVNGIFSLITGSTTPIMFSGLSRLQDDDIGFNKLFFTMQKIIAYLLLPISIGMFIYRDLLVDIFLGKQWTDSISVIGFWSLTSGITIVMGHYSSEIYRAKGKPKLSFIAQIGHLLFLIPTCFISANYGFNVLVIARALIRLQAIIVHLFLLHFIIKFPVVRMLKNTFIPIICSIIMGGVGMHLKKLNEGFLWDLLGIIICFIIYILLLFIFKESRSFLLEILNKKFKNIEFKLER